MKPFRNILISRVPFDLYRQAKQYAFDRGITLRQVFIDALTSYLRGK